MAGGRSRCLRSWRFRQCATRFRYRPRCLARCPARRLSWSYISGLVPSLTSQWGHRPCSGQVIAGCPREPPPEAPTDPSVTLWRHRAPVIPTLPPPVIPMAPLWLALVVLCTNRIPPTSVRAAFTGSNRSRRLQGLLGRHGGGRSHCCGLAAATPPGPARSVPNGRWR
jgi:hypothetical protein